MLAACESGESKSVRAAAKASNVLLAHLKKAGRVRRGVLGGASFETFPRAQMKMSTTGARV
jgi:hypothetical protein